MKKKIMVILGSESDRECIDDGLKIFQKLAVGVRLEIISAHRHPEKLRKLCLGLEKDGIEIVIACAGLAAALPGFIASYVNIPVLGVAMKGGLMDGLDAVMSMVSMPKGTPVGCCGSGKSGFMNACIMALEILSLGDRAYKKPLLEYRMMFK